MHIASTSHVRHFEGPLEGKNFVAAADLIDLSYYCTSFDLLPSTLQKASRSPSQQALGQLNVQL